MAITGPIQPGYSTPLGSLHRTDPDLGGHDFNKGSYFGLWYRRVDPLPAAARSDALLGPIRALAGRLQIDFFSSTANGGFSNYGSGYNVAAGDGTDTIAFGPSQQAMTYPSATQRQTVVLKAPPRVTEAVANLNFPMASDPGRDPSKIDYHNSDLIRDPATGGIGRLVEGYQCVFDDPTRPTRVAGTGLNQVDLSVPQPLPVHNDESGPTAAGTFIFPSLFLYRDFAEDKKHLGRCTINQSAGHRCYVGPARNGNGGWAPAGTGWPLGGIVRLKADWYDAHKAAYTGQARWLLDCWRQYGLMMDDWSVGPDVWVSGITNDGWVQADLNQFANLPVRMDAFELVAFPRAIVLTGPGTIELGKAATITATHEPADDLNWGAFAYWLTATHSDGRTVVQSPQTLTLAPGRPATATVKPTKPGAWTVEWSRNNGQLWWQEPYTLTVADPNAPPPAIPHRPHVAAPPPHRHDRRGRQTRRAKLCIP